MQDAMYATREIIEDRDRRTIHPVSADETLREFGRAGRRESGYGINIWRGRNVRPALATAGINVGGIIRTWRGDIEVTRVGTIAGWGVPVNHIGTEVRWDISEVREIIVPARGEEVAA